MGNMDFVFKSFAGLFYPDATRNYMHLNLSSSSIMHLLSLGLSALKIWGNPFCSGSESNILSHISRTRSNLEK
jgi:hypothetical protein